MVPEVDSSCYILASHIRMFELLHVLILDLFYYSHLRRYKVVSRGLHFPND